MPIVGRRLLLPQRARNDAEHRAAVEPEGTIVKRGQLQVAEGHRLNVQAHGRRCGLFQLDQHAMRRGRMDECDQRALGPRSGLLIDEPHAAGSQLLQGSADVIHPERDVMKPGTALLDIPGDHRVGVRWLEQLERRLAGGNEVRAHALAGHFLGHLDVQAQRIAIEGERFVEVLHRDADVVEDGLHCGVAGSAAVEPSRGGTRPTVAVAMSSDTAE